MKKYNKGSALLISFIIASSLSTVSILIGSILYKKTLITISSEKAQRAFYVADTGIECALRYEYSLAFDRVGFSNEIFCNGEAAKIPNSTRTDVIPANLTEREDFKFIVEPFGDGSCAEITVRKRIDGEIKTSIESIGKFPCKDSIEQIRIKLKTDLFADE